MARGVRRVRAPFRSPEVAARYAFLETLRQWDVVRINGTLRVIREVYAPEHRPFFRSFIFAILRCSWTHRATTVRAIHDLADPAKVKIELVGRNYRYKTPIEQALQKEIDARRCSRHTRTMECCDVIGVIT